MILGKQSKANAGKDKEKREPSKEDKDSKESRLTDERHDDDDGDAFFLMVR